jgi:ABC-type multidrug transport system fused ATPase/permease subunit
MLKAIKDLLSTADKNLKFNFYIIFPLVLIGSVLEVFFLSLIPVFIAILFSENNQILLISDYNKFLYALFSGVDLTETIYNFIIFLFLFAIFKFFYDSFTTVFQTKVIFKFKENLHKILLKKYINKNLIYFKTKNSSIIVRNLTTEIGLILPRVLYPLMNIFVNSVLFFSLLIYLFFYNFSSLIILCITSLIIFFFLKITTFSILKKNTIIQQLNEGSWIQSIQEIVGSIRELKILNNINNFLEKTNLFLKNSNKSHSKNIYIPLLTRNYIELVAIIIFLIIIFNAIKNNYHSSEIIQLISVYGFALFRMLPMSNKIFVSLQNFKSGKINLRNFFTEINSIECEEKNDYVKNNDSFRTIELRNISFNYLDKEILSNLNLKISKGQKIGIMGETGAGKSTFLEVLCNLIYPSSGSIIINNKKNNSNNASWRNLISYVPQDIFLLDGSIRDNILFFKKNGESSENILNNVLKISCMTDFISSLPKKDETFVGERGIKISGGQKQRIGIARALYNLKSILILDEATNALDMKIEKKIIANIFENFKDLTIVMVSHRKSSFDYCDKVYKLRNRSLTEL